MDQTVINREIIDLYDEFTHTAMPRRSFMRKLSKLVGGSAAAAVIAPMLACNYANAATIAENDDRIETKRITFKGASGDIKAYVAMPKGDGKYPSVVVTHQNRGLNPHIEDITRRLAVEGFLAMAPDYLSQLGGTPTDEDAASAMFPKLDMGKTVADGVAAVAFLETYPNSNGKVGAIGFCWGGGLTNQIAVHSQDLKAGVPYYGPEPKAEEAKSVKAKMMLHYAGNDERITGGSVAWVQALKDAGVEAQSFVYPGVEHAFNDDTAGPRYNEAAAKLAWSRTIDFLKKNLA